MRTRKGAVMAFVLASFITANAQEAQSTVKDVEEKIGVLEKEVAKLKKLSVSGYIQGQYQHGQEAASLKVGGKNENPDDSFSRMGIRRGRIKFVYTEGIASGVFQIDLTEKGIAFKDVYLNVKDPWFKTSALRAGIFDRPFGYEISYSSSRRESPERSTVFQQLFPEERDMGAMLILQPAKTSLLHFMKLEAGLFAGNGIKQETDSRKDFIGHLSAAKSFDNGFSFGAGVSHYNGSVYQGSGKVYKMRNGGFSLNESDANIGKYAKRRYYGFDARIAFTTVLGETHLRGEYLFGKQPGKESATKSPNSSSLPTYDTYIRDFQGGYIFLVQHLGTTPFAAVLKYDWYDPNTKVSGDDVGLKATSRTDLAQSTLGIGALWHVTKAVRLQAYYEFNNNEKTAAIENLNKNIKDDVFTLRLQYKF